MKIKWLAKAIQNLDDETEFIARDNPLAAQLLIARIRSAVDRLQTQLALGRPGRIEGTRELIVADTRYIIPYRVNTRLDRIEVLRVFHASRQPPPIW